MIFHAIILVIINILQDLNYFIHIIENICFVYIIYMLKMCIRDRYKDEESNVLSGTERTVMESFQTHSCKGELQSRLVGEMEEDKTA